jgi:hypothetical protein
MTRDEFDEALLRYGADFTRWPPREAEAARQLVAGDRDAAKMLADFRAFEDTIADAVRPPPLGTPEIGRVLASLDDTEETWRPGRGFWIAGASVSLLSFAAGAVLMVATLSSSGALDLALALVDVTAGGGEIGGLM